MASNTDGVGAAGAHKNPAETPTVPSSKAEEKKPVTVEAVVDDGDIPDPDEDDLDDLDGEFSYAPMPIVLPRLIFS